MVLWRTFTETSFSLNMHLDNLLQGCTRLFCKLLQICEVSNWLCNVTHGQTESANQSTKISIHLLLLTLHVL